MRRSLVIVLLLSLPACSSESARDSFCSGTEVALHSTSALDVTVAGGVDEYRTALASVRTLADSLDSRDKATLVPELDRVIGALDESLAGRGSGWQSIDLMETIWDWCGPDVGIGFTVQP